MAVKVFLVLVGLATVSCRHVNFYRKDYMYVDEYDAFYKFHWDVNGTTWGSSFLSCDDEGAELFYPRGNEEWTVVKKLADAANSAPNVTDIFVGIHDKFGLGDFLTVDGRPISGQVINMPTLGEDRCVTMNIDTGALATSECFTDVARPFVCKKVEDVSCPTIDKGYKYLKETQKCYKRNDTPKTWSRAMETCYMEGGILLVMTNDVEADVLRRYIITDGDSYYAGIKRIFPHNQFYTVTGHQVRGSGFERWYNEDNRRQYDCGLVTEYNNILYYNAVNCDNELPFVCQMEVTP